MDNNEKYVFFDFDGTIANTYDYYYDLVIKTLPMLGFGPVEPTTIKVYRNKNFWDVIKELKIPFWKVAYLVWKVKSNLNKDIELIKPFPGIKDVVKTLHEHNINIGVISINSKDNVTKFINLNDLNKYINKIWTLPFWAEKNNTLEKIIRKNKLFKNNAVYVGDEIRDILACKKAGIRIIAVSWGVNTYESLVANGADFVVKTPEELLEKLEYLFNSEIS